MTCRSRIMICIELTDGRPSVAYFQMPCQIGSNRRHPRWTDSLHPPELRAFGLQRCRHSYSRTFDSDPDPGWSGTHLNTQCPDKYSLPPRPTNNASPVNPPVRLKINNTSIFLLFQPSLTPSIKLWLTANAAASTMLPG